MKLAYHYAPGNYLEAISMIGHLVPSGEGGAAAESPAVWFSTRTTYEPTALKNVMLPDGTVCRLWFSELAGTYGAMRFGLAADDTRLLPWTRACTAIGIAREERRVLENRGRKLRAEPAHWFAVLSAVSLDELALEVWYMGEWVAVQRGKPINTAEPDI